MPKINKEQAQENRAHLEKAALKCFLKKGYHGVTVREIAKAAKVSLGNLYVYYPDKLTLFKTIGKNLEAEYSGPGNPIWQYIATSDFPNDLERLAQAVEEATDKYASYFKLTYIDIVEFEGAHVRGRFTDTAERLAAPLQKHFEKIGKLGPNRDIEPLFAFVAAYLQFYYLFVLKKLFKAKNVYGPISDKQVIDQLKYIYMHGLNSPKSKK